LEAWYSVNGAALSLKNLTVPLSKALKTSLRVTAPKKPGRVGFFNDGYWGIDVKKQKYAGSFWVKGNYKGDFTASLSSNITGETFGSVKVKSKATEREWVEHKYTLIPSRNAPNSNNTFSLTFESAVSSTLKS
jgi:alpha-N-arabinofuranosidase